jgi:hypothetical protein
MMEPRVKMMTVEQVHQWARAIPGLPRGARDAFGGQCFLEDVDGVDLLAQTRDTLCSDLGVEAKHVDAVESAIEALRSGVVPPSPGVGRAAAAVTPPRGVHEAFHDLMLSEGVPPRSPATAARAAGVRSPLSTQERFMQVEHSLSGLEARHGGVVELQKRLSEEAFDSAERETTASAAADEAVRLDLEDRLSEQAEARTALQQRVAAAEREIWTARQESAAMLATAEGEHAEREDELEARIAGEREARLAAERRRDEMEDELGLALAMGEAAEEQLAAELCRAREDRAATKIQMVWRVHRVTKAGLTAPLDHRALLLEVASARVAAAVVNVQIQVGGAPAALAIATLHAQLPWPLSAPLPLVCVQSDRGSALSCAQNQALQEQLKQQEAQLESEARMREAMQAYAKQRLARGPAAASSAGSASTAAITARAAGDEQAVLRQFALLGTPEQAAPAAASTAAAAATKRTPINSPTAASSVLSSPVTPVTECSEAEEHPYRQQQQRQQRQEEVRKQVAMDEV